MSTRVEFDIGTPEKAERLFQTGLKHRILPLPPVAGAGVGDAIVVVMSLHFTGESFELPAKVMHCGAGSTVVKLDELPDAVIAALAGEAPASTSPSVDQPPAEPEPTEPEPAEPEPAERKPIALPAQPDSQTEIPAVKPPSKPASRFKTRGFKLKGPRGGRSDGATPPSKSSSAKSHYSLDPTPTSTAGPVIPVPGGGGKGIKATLEDEGSLEDLDMRSLLISLLRRSALGVLVVEGYRELNWCFVVHGKPVKFLREPPSRSDTLDYQASRARLVEPDEMNRARQLTQLTGQRIEEVLGDLGLMDADALRKLEAKTAWQVTERLLGVNYGTYRFFHLPGLDKVLHSAPADVMGVLWTRARAKYAELSDKKIAHRIDQYHKHHMVLTDEGKELAEQLSLGKREALFVQRYLRGGWQIAELLGRLDLTNRTVMEIVFTLEELGIIDLSEREGPNWRIARAERFLIDRMDYMDKDHFAFVDAHWSSLEPELLVACDKVARTLDDPVMNQLELGSVGQMREQIIEKLGEVREIFVHHDHRREYRGGLIEKSKRTMATSLFAAQGEMALFKKEAVLAKECFQRVVELDAGGPGTDHVGRARRVLDDISRGVLTQATKVDDRNQLSLEDIDNG
jgi:hypothetical protein